MPETIGAVAAAELPAVVAVEDADAAVEMAALTSEEVEVEDAAVVIEELAEAGAALTAAWVISDAEADDEEAAAA